MTLNSSPRADGCERPQHRAVLNVLRGAAGPVGAAEVAAHPKVHANTARFHRDTPVAEGSAERTVEEPSGPGRPRTGR